MQPLLSTRLLLAAAVLMTVPALLRAADAPGPDKAAPASEARADPAGAGGKVPGRRSRVIEGWTVHLSEALLDTRKDETEKMIGLLAEQLAYIVKVVPAPAVEELRKVPLWISPEYPNVPPTAEYHPDAGWLRDHGRDPAMAKGVEFTDVRSFAREVKRMPVVVLHELAHGYHDRVLGFDQPDVIACYKRAKDGKTYDAVERWNGPGRPVTTERAYAMTNEKEYFAECSEAFFGRNDFFPFTRDELEKHDPDMFNLLVRLWNRPPAGEKAK